MTLDKIAPTSRFALLLRSNRRTNWLTEAGGPICKCSENQPFDTDVLCFIATASYTLGAADLRSGSAPRSIQAARVLTRGQSK